MITYNTIVVVTGVALLGMSSGIVGTFAVLRRRALMGDALAHASLPGLCIAFLLFEQRDLYVLLSGAFVSSLVGITVVALLRRWTRIKEDAAIGIVLSVFFGWGIVLSRLIQNRDTQGSKAGLDSFLLGKTAGMIAEDVYVIATASLVMLFTVLFLYKELKLVTFDTGFARSQGWPTVWLDLAVLSLVAVTVMIGLPAVGVVMIAALLILPAASARFWSDRLSRILMIAALFGGVIGVAGSLLSARYSKFPAGPVIVLTGTVVLLVSMLFAPRRGILAQSISERRFRRNLEDRNTLRLFFDYCERAGKSVPIRIDELINLGANRASITRLIRNASIRPAGSHEIVLTEDGLEYARGVAVGVRLWEAFFDKQPDVASSMVDLTHESVADLLDVDLTRELEDKLRREGRWPHDLALVGGT